MSTETVLPKPSYLGLSGAIEVSDGIEIAFCLHDGTYPTDNMTMTFSMQKVSPESGLTGPVEKRIVAQVSDYSHHHSVKIIGAGVAKQLLRLCPTLCSRLWQLLDILPVLVPVKSGFEKQTLEDQAEERMNYACGASMQAYSAVRKCLM